MEVQLPADLVQRFKNHVDPNTSRNKETCGWLVGKKVGKRRIEISHILIPPQRGDDVSCEATDEMAVFFIQI